MEIHTGMLTSTLFKYKNLTLTLLFLLPYIIFFPSDHFLFIKTCQISSCQCLNLLTLV